MTNTYLLKGGSSVHLQQGLVLGPATHMKGSSIDRETEIRRDLFHPFDVQREPLHGLGHHIHIVEQDHPAQEETAEELCHVIILRFRIPPQLPSDFAQQAATENCQSR